MDISNAEFPSKSAYTHAMYLATLGVFFALAVWLEVTFRVHLYRTRGERILITLIFFVVGVSWDSVMDHREDVGLSR